MKKYILLPLLLMSSFADAGRSNRFKRDSISMDSFADPFNDERDGCHQDDDTAFLSSLIKKKTIV